MGELFNSTKRASVRTTARAIDKQIQAGQIQIQGHSLELDLEQDACNDEAKHNSVEAMAISDLQKALDSN